MTAETDRLRAILRHICKQSESAIKQAAQLDKKSGYVELEKHTRRMIQLSDAAAREGL